MSKPARKAAEAAPKRASKPRKTAKAMAQLHPTDAPKGFNFTFTPNTAKPIFGCPFVRFNRDIGVEPCMDSWWCVPATTGYEVGWRIGSIMGRFYLRAISTDSGARVAGSYLPCILMALMERLSGADPNTVAGLEARLSLRGQLFGFLEVIEQSAAHGARGSAKGLAQFDTDKAVRLANAGLLLDEAEYRHKKARMHRLKDQIEAMPGAEIMAGHHLELLRD